MADWALTRSCESVIAPAETKLLTPKAAVHATIALARDLRTPSCIFEEDSHLNGRLITRVFQVPRIWTAPYGSGYPTKLTVISFHYNFFDFYYSQREFRPLNLKTTADITPRKLSCSWADFVYNTQTANWTVRSCFSDLD